MKGPPLRRCGTCNVRTTVRTFITLRGGLSSIFREISFAPSSLYAAGAREHHVFVALKVSSPQEVSVQFAEPKLEQEFRDALKFFSEIDCDVEVDGSALDETFVSADLPDILVDAETSVWIGSPRTEDSAEMTLTELCSISTELRAKKYQFDGLDLRLSKTAFRRVDAADVETEMVLDHLQNVDQPLFASDAIVDDVRGYWAEAALSRLD